MNKKSLTRLLAVAAAALLILAACGSDDDSSSGSSSEAEASEMCHQCPLDAAEAYCGALDQLR